MEQNQLLSHPGAYLLATRPLSVGHMTFFSLVCTCASGTQSGISLAWLVRYPGPNVCLSLVITVVWELCLPSAVPSQQAGSLLSPQCNWLEDLHLEKRPRVSASFSVLYKEKASFPIRNGVCWSLFLETLTKHPYYTAGLPSPSHILPR